MKGFRHQGHLKVREGLIFINGDNHCFMLRTFNFSEVASHADQEPSAELNREMKGDYFFNCK